MQQEKKTDCDLRVRPGTKLGEISPYLYGACMEDVNHELYGGIWSQMIFGESFAEPAEAIIPEGFRAGGGFWKTEPDGQGGNCLVSDEQNNGPKMVLEGTECRTGRISADIYWEGEGPNGFVIKTSDVREGANNFIGYEVGLYSEGILRLAKHEHDFQLIKDYPCEAFEKQWVNLAVDMTEDSMTVYVNGKEAVRYTDPNPIKEGGVCLRAWNSSVKYKNIRFGREGEAEHGIEVPAFTYETQLSFPWEETVRGGAQGVTEFVTTNPYKGKQSQRICYLRGEGAFGINNMGLNRMGMHFAAGKPYEGYIYARSAAPATLYLVMESADGDRQYAETAVQVSSGDFQKYAFTLTPDGSDKAGRLSIELRAPGEVDLGYAFMQPGEWGRFKGLPVRRDVAEKLIEQKVSVLRFGGCMANAAGYKWKQMLGAPETRPAFKSWWYPWGSYGFGIPEFLSLCEALDIPAVPDFNSYETPEDMADFIDFALGTDESNPWVQKRMELGHPAPYKLRYLQFGNEEKVNEAYAARFNAMAPGVWEKAPDLILIVGDFDYKEPVIDPYHLTGTAAGITTLAPHKSMLDLATAHGREIWFDIHIWSGRPKDPVNFFDVSVTLDAQLKKICPDARFRLVCFELNANEHDLHRALSNAYAINRGERLGYIFPIICSANALQVDGQNDNGWDQGLLFMDSEKAWLQPPGYVTRMAAEVHLPYLADMTVEGDTAGLDITAATDETGSRTSVKLLNLTDAPRSLTLSLEGQAGDRTACLTVLTAPDVLDANPAEDTQRVVPVSKDITLPADGLELELPAYSYVTIVTR